MPETNLPPLDQEIEKTIDLAQQAIEHTRAEIARSHALSQAEADLARSIERIADEQDSLMDGNDAAAPGTWAKRKRPVVSRERSKSRPKGYV